MQDKMSVKDKTTIGSNFHIGIEGGGKKAKWRGGGLVLLNKTSRDHNSRRVTQLSLNYIISSFSSLVELLEAVLIDYRN